MSITKQQLLEALVRVKVHALMVRPAAFQEATTVAGATRSMTAALRRAERGSGDSVLKLSTRSSVNVTEYKLPFPPCEPLVLRPSRKRLRRRREVIREACLEICDPVLANLKGEWALAFSTLDGVRMAVVGGTKHVQRWHSLTRMVVDLDDLMVRADTPPALVHHHPHRR